MLAVTGKLKKKRRERKTKERSKRYKGQLKEERSKIITKDIQKGMEWMRRVGCSDV